MENLYEKLKDYDFSLDSDDQDFRENLEKAVGGEAEAMYRLGGYYSNLFYTEDDVDGDLEKKAEVWDLKALYWYEKAAEQGHISALCCMGHLYYDGNGFDSDLEKAAHWYMAAAELGNAEAQMWLGTLYQKGFGIEENKEKAVHWFTKAAEQGNGLAAGYLGVCYQRGDGVKQDIKKSVYWLLIADENGDFDAWEKLNEIVMEPNAARTYGFTTDEVKKINLKIKQHKKAIEEYEMSLVARLKDEQFNKLYDHG